MTVRSPVMLDTHIVYRLVEDPGALAVARSADVPFDLITTHIQLDQVARRPEDAVRGAALEQLERMRQVTTAGMVWGASRWGAATWTGAEDAEILRERAHPESTKERLRRATDRLLITTAQRDGAVLVTDDVKLTMHAQRQAPALEVWAWPRFRAELLVGVPAGAEAAWDALRAALPRGWIVGRPSYHGRDGWVIYAYDPSERPRVGKRSREREAIAPTESGVVLEMARRLSTPG